MCLVYVLKHVRLMSINPLEWACWRKYVNEQINIKHINMYCELITYLRNRFGDAVLFKLIFSWKVTYWWNWETYSYSQYLEKRNFRTVLFKYWFMIIKTDEIKTYFLQHCIRWKMLFMIVINIVSYSKIK